MKRLTFILFVLLVSFHLQAQERGKTPIGGRPDIQGDLFLDFGFNILNDRPEDMDTRFFPSRTVNIYFQRPFYLGENSGFTFNPGIGFGLDKLAFSDDQTLVNDPDKGNNSSQLVAIEDVYGTGVSVDKNTMALNYIDIPLEFRYHVNRSNYTQGFRFAIGGKIGVLYNAHTKIKITDADGLTQKIKNTQDFGLNPVRYGIYTRIGMPGFNVWGYYGLNEVFEDGQGPFENQAKQFNFGISVALF